jgi:hypothetical protein
MFNKKKSNLDAATLGVQTGVGIAKKIPDLIPTPENLYQVSKQTLIGLPFELLISGIDKLCKKDVSE